MKSWIAHRLNRSLLENDSTGKIVRPGGNAQKRWVQPDRGDVTIIARGDAFDLYIGRKDIYNVALSTRTARQLGFWLVRWWIIDTWCGLKHRLWYWSLGVLLVEPDESRTKAPALGDGQRT